jgi:hypothetical protein
VRRSVRRIGTNVLNKRRCSTGGSGTVARVSAIIGENAEILNGYLGVAWDVPLAETAIREGRGRPREEDLSILGKIGPLREAPYLVEPQSPVLQKSRYCVGMSTLHVRNVPERLYEALRRYARKRNSSISAEVIRLLERALRIDRPGVRELLAEIERNRPAARRTTGSAARLVREDRDRR